MTHTRSVTVLWALFTLFPASGGRLHSQGLEIYDDFEDGDYTDGCPARWEMAPARPGPFDVVNGDVVARQGLPVQAGFLQTQQVFSGDVAVRTQGTFGDLDPGETEVIYVGAHADGKLASGYLVALTSEGQAQQAMYLEDLVVWSDAAVIPDFDSREDYVLQVDVIDSRIEARIWKPQECPPEGPIFPPREDDGLQSGTVGAGFHETGILRYVWAREGGAAILSECDLPGSLLPPCSWPPRFLRADCNHDGTVDISDAEFALGFLFLGDGEPGCNDACDSNDDGAVDISDAINTLGVLFLGSGTIPLPGMSECGVDPTEDGIDCDSFERCP